MGLVFRLLLSKTTVWENLFVDGYRDENAISKIGRLVPEFRAKRVGRKSRLWPGRKIYFAFMVVMMESLDFNFTSPGKKVLIIGRVGR